MFASFDSFISECSIWSRKFWSIFRSSLQSWDLRFFRGDLHVFDFFGNTHKEAQACVCHRSNNQLLVFQGKRMAYGVYVLRFINTPITNSQLLVFIRFSRLCTMDSFVWRAEATQRPFYLAPLWCNPGCLTFPIVTSSARAWFLSLRALTGQEGVTSFSPTEYKSTFLSSTTRHWAL